MNIYKCKNVRAYRTFFNNNHLQSYNLSNLDLEILNNEKYSLLFFFEFADFTIICE